MNSFKILFTIRTGLLLSIFIVNAAVLVFSVHFNVHSATTNAHESFSEDEINIVSKDVISPFNLKDH